jgi:altronate dehydratase small subunit
MKRAIRMNASDNVITTLANLDAGETIQVVSASQEPLEQLKALQPISFGHKLAMNRIEKGSNIFKYGEVIGIATQSIEKGAHVHIHNVESARIQMPKAVREREG